MKVEYELDTLAQRGGGRSSIDDAFPARKTPTQSAPNSIAHRSSTKAVLLDSHRRLPTPSSSISIPERRSQL